MGGKRRPKAIARTCTPTRPCDSSKPSRVGRSSPTLPSTAPHEPLQVSDRDLQPYLGLTPYRGEPGVGHPLPKQVPAETTTKVYAMVSNIDANVGRLLDKLHSLALSRDTIVVFLTDNGPQQPRYNAGMLDRKGNVPRGGDPGALLNSDGRARSSLAGSSTRSPPTST